ncbi:MAG TPA: hypothetical protein VNN79_12565, partial [Actinomycetota bacterium]|nr:hypothetical protein [Actinomycetota bacterium]
MLVHLSDTRASILLMAPACISARKNSGEMVMVRGLMTGVTIALAMCSVVVPARAQVPDSTAAPLPVGAEHSAPVGRPELLAYAIPKGGEREIRLDGRLDESVWKDA